MAPVGTKRSLPVDEDTITIDGPRKKLAVTGMSQESKTTQAASQTLTQATSPQSSYTEAKSGSDVPSSFTQPTSQETVSQPSPSQENIVNNNKLPRIPKRPAEEEAPRPRKRPGAGARIDRARSDAVLEKRKREEEEALKIALSRGGDEVVRQHYNLVPQRGREWRSTESKIKGLRKYNNWVKSVLINRFSQPENRDAPPLRVLDLGCGKGGDLQKWHAAPHRVELYVGIDPAEVSIDQAKDRYAEMRRGGSRAGRGGRGGFRGGRQQPPLYDAEFTAQDAFGQPIDNIPVIQHVGFDAAGSSRWGEGGFDVVSMMFCMHYAFESEAKTRGMLTNVAGSLKKGGRFLGVIPNSDVIRSKVTKFHATRKKLGADDALNAEKPSTPDGPHNAITDLGPRKAQVSGSPHISGDLNGTTSDKPETREKEDKADDQVDGKSGTASTKDSLNDQASSTALQKDESHQVGGKEDATAEWGNDIYRVRFPGKTPEDGIFRPPFGWKYNYFMEEAVEEVPEYVVPWEAFRALAEDYNLEMMYRKPFAEVWKEEQDHHIFGPLSERMGVRGRDRGPLLVNEDEMDAASMVVDHPPAYAQLMQLH